jgi:hypothetical protein
LGYFGDLDGIIAAASDDDSGPLKPAMSRTVRAKVTAAADYLAVAPTVVAVVRHLPLGSPDAAIVDPAVNSDALDALTEKWGLGGSMDRARTALADAAG